MMSDRSPAPKKIALVVGSGAVKCAAALGLWKVLHREGIPLSMVVGCSGGSLYTSVMALGFDRGQCEEMTRRMWTRDVTAERDLRSLASVFLPKLFGFGTGFGLVKDRRLNTALRQTYGDRTFADAKIPLYVAATDLVTGDKVVLSDGPVFDAIRASIAIPYVWPAWKIGDRRLVDGCVSNPLPVDVAIKEGADIILAMGFDASYPRSLKSASRYAFQLNSIYTNNLLRASYAFHNLAHHAEIIPVLPDFDRPIGLFDTGKFPYVIGQGERAAEAILPYLHQLLDDPAA
jgi:NTE family protein